MYGTLYAEFYFVVWLLRSNVRPLHAGKVHHYVRRDAGCILQPDSNFTYGYTPG